MARIYISLKKGVADPQGQTIKQALNDIGFSEVREIRVGKFFDVVLTEPINEPHKILEKISSEVLANPIIEEFSIEGIK